LRIVLPDKNWNAGTVNASTGATASLKQEDTLVRATIQSANSGEVNWSVTFK